MPVADTARVAAPAGEILTRWLGGRHPSAPPGRILLLIAALSGLLPGCGDDGAEQLYPVEGRVLLQGQALNTSAGYVVLKPDTSRGNLTRSLPGGTIDAEGNYRIYTDRREGAPAGWYKVIVTATGTPPAPSPARNKQRPAGKSLVNTQYGQETTTPLSLEVVSEPAEGAYDLKLEP